MKPAAWLDPISWNTRLVNGIEDGRIWRRSTFAQGVTIAFDKGMELVQFLVLVAVGA